MPLNLCRPRRYNRRPRKVRQGHPAQPNRNKNTGRQENRPLTRHKTKRLPSCSIRLMSQLRQPQRLRSTIPKLQRQRHEGQLQKENFPNRQIVFLRPQDRQSGYPATNQAEPHHPSTGRQEASNRSNKKNTLHTPITGRKLYLYPQEGT